MFEFLVSLFTEVGAYVESEVWDIVAYSKRDLAFELSKHLKHYLKNKKDIKCVVKLLSKTKVDPSTWEPMEQPILIVKEEK